MKYRYLKWLFNSLLAVLAIVAILVVAVTLLLGTGPGTRYAIDLVNSFVPGDVRIERYDGTLWDGLEIDHLVFEDEKRRVSARDVVLSINWASAFAGRIVIERLRAGSAEYEKLTPPPAEREPFSLSMQPIPVIVGVNDGRIDSLIVRGQNSDLDIREIEIRRLRISGDRLRVALANGVAAGVEYNLSDLDTRFSGDVPLQANVRWNVTNNAWSGVGRVSETLADLHIEQAISGPYPGTVSGTIAIQDQLAPMFDLAVDWNQWQIRDVVVGQGNGHINGTIRDYSVRYDTSIRIPGLPVSQLTGTASGNPNSLAVFVAELTSTAGTANATGSLTWLPQFSIVATASVADADPSLIHNSLTGRLAATGDITVDNSGNFSLANVELDGVLNDLPINGQIDLARDDQTYRCDDCTLVAGSNRLVVSGTYNEQQFSADTAINAPNLASLLPDLSGSLSGAGQLSGSLDQVEFVGDLTGSQVQFQGWKVGSAKLDSRSMVDGRLAANLQIQDLAMGESQFGSGNIEARGTYETFEVDLAWQYLDNQLSAMAQVVRSEDSVRADVQRASLTEPNTGTWTLQEAFQVTLQDGGVVASGHEWQGRNGSLQITEVVHVTDQTTIIARATDLPLNLANPFLPTSMTLAGTASAEIDVQTVANELRGSVRWEQHETAFTIAQVDEQQTVVHMPTMLADIEFSQGGAVVDARVGIDPGVSGELSLTLQSFAADSQMTADLRLAGADWSWIASVIPSIDNFEGGITANLQASGSLNRPQIAGTLRWQNGSLVIPALNVPVTAIDVTMRGGGSGSTSVEGTANAGKGTLKINGTLRNLLAGNRMLELQLEGQTAEIINWQDYRVWASPNVTVRNTADGWQINGMVGVPEAEINVRELPVEAIKPSSDVVVVGEQRRLDNTVNYSGETTLELGDNVHINAFGLDTRLTGSLRVRAARNRPLRAEGKLNLLDGTFGAYGQKLTIEEGTLTFTGPLDDPLVDVRAVRKIDTIDGTVSAGLNLNGRANDLKSSVWSEPIMSESEALSYLMLGRPLARATDAEGNELSRAAYAMGLRQATRITEELGQSIGLDQLSLTGDGGDTTALVAGKQINSRMYARYAYGIFNQIGTLLLRYRLSERLSLEAGAGKIQSIDILYTVEKQ